MKDVKGSPAVLTDNRHHPPCQKTRSPKATCKAATQSMHSGPVDLVAAFSMRVAKSKYVDFSASCKLAHKVKQSGNAPIVLTGAKTRQNQTNSHLK